MVPSSLEDLLSKLIAAGAVVTVRGIKLIIDAPPGALSPELLADVAKHKPELIALARLHAPCEACGGIGVVDTPIHGGRSLRRDCARCHRTLGFPVWTPEDQRG